MVNRPDSKVWRGLPRNVRANAAYSEINAVKSLTGNDVRRFPKDFSELLANRNGLAIAGSAETAAPVE
jgi:hypothetical protein